MEINQSYECDVIERNGKHYLNVKSLGITVNFEDYSMKFECGTGIPIVYDTINHIINANRRLFFLENEQQFKNVLSEVTTAVFAPIFNKIAIQDFFQQNSE